MSAAVIQEVALTGSEKLVVSGDGTWRERGFTSLQGITSVIGNKSGKVIDVSTKCSFCKACSTWEGKEDTSEYEGWLETHKTKCSCNHIGCAGKM